MKKQKGFTLIELLVVIAIIAILSTVVMAGLNSARQKGRDAKRLSDIKAMQSALELYFDTCGGYPGNPVPAAGETVDGTAGVFLAADTFGGCATPIGTYINPLPSDPSPGGADYVYFSLNSSGTRVLLAAGNNAPSYNLTFTLEGASGALALGTQIATPSGIVKGP